MITVTCKYGLGLFKEDQYEVVARANPKQLYMVGHAGTDFASAYSRNGQVTKSTKLPLCSVHFVTHMFTGAGSAVLSSFNSYFGFGIALATNSAMGLDCTRDQPAFETEGDHGSITACLVLDVVVRLYGHEGLNCEMIGDRTATDELRAHRRSQTRAPGRRKPAAALPTALRRELGSSGTPATCAWTELYGTKCDVCATQPCVTCEQTCSSPAAACASCRHSHPWTHDGALSRAGILPCGNMCRNPAGGCGGTPPPQNSSWRWSGGTVAFFNDSACTIPADQAWNVSGDCSTSLRPGAPFPGAPIPLGHLALGCNGTHADVVFGASTCSCNDSRVVWPGVRIMPAAGAGQCVAASDSGELYFVAMCAQR